MNIFLVQGLGFCCAIASASDMFWAPFAIGSEGLIPAFSIEMPCFCSSADVLSFAASMVEIANSENALFDVLIPDTTSLNLDKRERRDTLYICMVTNDHSEVLIWKCRRDQCIRRYAGAQLHHHSRFYRDISSGKYLTEDEIGQDFNLAKLDWNWPV